jgi:RNA polymerase sigma factor (sigma-70 family)
MDVQLARSGDRTAWLRLVRSTRNLVSAIALGVVNDVSTSEDIAQDVYLQAWQGLRRLRAPESFLPWLRQLTRHRSHDVLRRRKRTGPSLDDEALSQLEDPKADPQEALLTREEHARLTHALEGLPDDAREVLVLFYREGQSVAQVSVLLELSEVAVKKRLSRAREQLRTRLDEELLARSAPGEAFCAAVLTATGGVPTFGAGVGAAVLKGAAGKLAGGLLGALGGGVISAASILWGYRREAAMAYDEAERAEHRRIRNANLLLTGSFSVASTVGALLDKPNLILVSGFIFVLAMLVPCGLWLPRVVARHQARELAEALDPEATRARHHRRLLMTRGGLIVGFLLAITPLLWALSQR